jgi:hypothetical protein|tara:strand:- start:302 stop:505 length:204 start_codon:yes stop_codon:yes gene_type:complete
MDYNTDNLVDNAYRDREPLEHSGNVEIQTRINKIQDEVEVELRLNRKETEKKLFKLIDELTKKRTSK